MNWKILLSKKFAIPIVLIILTAILVPVLVVTFRTDDPIHIESDDDFVKYNFPGYGTSESPYIIENLFIKGDPDTHGSAIEIEFTLAHFVIRNCKLIGFRSDSIALNQVAAGTAKIFDNVLDDFSYFGIGCYGSDGVIITNNNLSNGYHGVFMEECHNSTIGDNSIHSAVHGIHVTYSDSINIQDNILSLNDIGIYLENTDNITLHNNEVLGKYSQESAGTGSDLFGPAIIILSGDRTLITNNTCSFHPDAGIRLIHSHFCNISFNIFRDNQGTEEGRGIYLRSSNNSFIFYNLISSNEARGMLVMNSYNNTIHHNAFLDNGFGVAYHVYETDSDYNIWYDVLLLEGNYWSSWDYMSPYPITGSVSTDPYPMSSNPFI